ncbi:hypothetical protein FQR65_LT06972 [Abscondita terminalis]|nr:hypothetical protein FQR65_LT06972 [Abscondita terminalis]
MTVLGIEFAPLNTPLERRLQTLAAGGWFLTLASGPILGYLTAVYLLFFTRFWLNVLLYLIWIWCIDRDTCERGGRPLNWVRSLSCWSYMKDYFPITLKKAEDFDLDPKKNYMFCCFPHGMLSTSAFSSFATTASGFSKLFPNHTPHLVTLRLHFLVPFFREYIYSLGMCSSSAQSIKWILQNPNGGNITAIMVGGVQEAFYSEPNKHRLVLKNRKGFVKIALKTGTPLVPVFSFGETEIFDQFRNPLLQKFQYLVKRFMSIAPIVPIGRGFLQYNYGFVPERKPLTTVFGAPIEVTKIDDPTQEEIDDLHQKFIDNLTKCFEENKHKYISNADDAHLEIL